MNWLFTAVGTGLAFCAWLSDEEKITLDNHQLKTKRLNDEIIERQQQLESFRIHHQDIHDYQKHIALHYQSHLTANACYAHYQEKKQMLALINERIKELSTQINNLKNQKDKAHNLQQPALYTELNTLRECLQEAKQQRKIIAEQKHDLLEKIRLMNQKTHELKLYIRDNCGHKGREWYQRSLERRSLRS